MKKFTKLAALVLAVLLVLGLSACGGSTKAAAVSGVYLTPA